jgi:hypothetical protein
MGFVNIPNQPTCDMIIIIKFAIQIMFWGVMQYSFLNTTNISLPQGGDSRFL